MAKSSQEWEHLYRDILVRLVAAGGWLIEVVDRRAGEMTTWSPDGTERKLRDHLQRAVRLPRRQLGPANSTYDWYPATPVADALKSDDCRIFCFGLHLKNGVKVRAALFVDSGAFRDSQFSGELEFLSFCQELLESLTRFQANNLEADIFRQLASAISLDGIVVDSGGHIVADFSHDNPDFAKLLRSDFRDPTSIRKFLSRALDQENKSTKLPIRLKGRWARVKEIVHVNGEVPVVLHLITFNGAGTGTNSSDSSTLYVIVEPMSARSPSARSLQGLFSLTPAESRVVHRLVNGMPVSAISRELNLSDQTVRTYLKRSFGKVGVSSQTQLIYKVAGIRGYLNPERPV